MTQLTDAVKPWENPDILPDWVRLECEGGRVCVYQPDELS